MKMVGGDFLRVVVDTGLYSQWRGLGQVDGFIFFSYRRKMGRVRGTRRHRERGGGATWPRDFSIGMDRSDSGPREPRRAAGVGEGTQRALRTVDPNGRLGLAGPGGASLCWAAASRRPPQRGCRWLA
jgi:hypothetical protein